MILYTVVREEDIFRDFSENEENSQTEIVTDPFEHLKKDDYINTSLQMRI